MRKVLVYLLSAGLLLVFCSALVSGDGVEIRKSTISLAGRPAVGGGIEIDGNLAAGGGGLGAKVYAQGNGSFAASGTVSVTTTTNTVTGTGTAFLTELQVGDRLMIGGASRPVTAIASNNSLTASSSFGLDLSAQPMTVYPAIFRLDNSSGAPQVLVTDLGNMQLGAVVSATPRLLVYQPNRFSGTSVASSLNGGNLVVASTSGQGVDVGGVLGLGGSRGSTTGIAVFGGVRGGKENGTNDDVRGYLGLYTTDNGNLFAERARIASTGNLGVGTADPGQKIEVNGGVRLNTVTARPACDATVRGTFWATQQGSGVEDSVEVCVKDATDAYVWKTVF